MSGQLIGMRYEAVEVVIRRVFDNELTGEDFKRFQSIEHHFSNAINS